MAERLHDAVGERCLSVCARELCTGETVGFRPQLRFVTASIVKVEILLALLMRARRDGRELTDGERAAAARMIEVSDNDAAHGLWARVGRDAGMADVDRALGLYETEPDPESWGVTRTSAADQVRLLAELTPVGTRLDKQDRGYPLDLMAGVTDVQRWGVGAVARPGDRVVLKNGWLPYSKDAEHWTVNTIGRVTGDGHDLLLAVLSSGHATLQDGIRAVERAVVITAEALRPD